MMAGDADRSTGLFAVLRGRIKLIGGFFVARSFGNESHIVQRKRAVGIELVCLAEILIGLLILIVVERGHALHLQARGRYPGRSAVICNRARTACSFLKATSLIGLPRHLRIKRDHDRLGRMRDRSVVVEAKR